jgi:MFS family permease
MRKALNLTVLVAALGYFVDMFDLTIFGVVRMASLKDLGITQPEQLTSAGVWLLNLQAAGMLVGGLFWGVLGDRKGRLSVLFGSIIMYSLANIANGFANDLTTYGILRFIAGVGLAGELGAAITLVSETMDKETRGYGTTIIATLGLLGAVAASLVGQLWHWRTAYFIGGGIGLLLLAARFHMADSGMFEKAQNSSHRGDLRLLLDRERGLRYVYCILVGVPIYFITGVLFTFSPELTKALGIEGITAGNALLFGSIGLTLGDLMSGLTSQWMKSRKKAMGAFIAAGAGLAFVYLRAPAGLPKELFYVLCFALGTTAGFWAVLVTAAAEQFGTNIRATVATSVPNFVRSAVILLTLSFSYLKVGFGTISAAMTVGAFVFAMAFMALYRMRETFGVDLDYFETAGEPVLATEAVQSFKAASGSRGS